MKKHKNKIKLTMSIIILQFIMILYNIDVLIIVLTTLIIILGYLAGRLDEVEEDLRYMEADNESNNFIR